MDDVVTVESSSLASGFVERMSAYVANGLRFWEPAHLVYNCALALVVVAQFLWALPGARQRLSLDLVLGVFFLAVLANVCYCVAYLPDMFVQFSGLHQAWRIGRVILFTVGTAFAATITHFFAIGLFGG